MKIYNISSNKTKIHQKLCVSKIRLILNSVCITFFKTIFIGCGAIHLYLFNSSYRKGLINSVCQLTSYPALGIFRTINLYKTNA